MLCARRSGGADRGTARVRAYHCRRRPDVRIAGSIVRLGCAAERTGLAVLQFCPVNFKLRNSRQEGHFPQQGLLLGTVFPQRAVPQYLAQSILALLQLF